MLVEENIYIPPFGGWSEVCALVEKIHTYLRLGAGVRYVCDERTYIAPFGGWCEVCMLVDEDTYIPPFGGWCEVCL